jgi:hypothetical protein
MVFITDANKNPAAIVIFDHRRRLRQKPAFAEKNPKPAAAADLLMPPPP